MGTSQLHALGRNRKFYAVDETTFGTFVKPTGGDAVKVLSASFDPSQERKNREDSRATRSHIADDQIDGKKAASWSVEAYLIPSGDATNSTTIVPDIDQLLTKALGTGTATSSPSKMTYTLNSNQDLGSLTLVQHFNETFMEALTGCYVNSMTLSIAGGEEPKLSFEGGSSGTFIPTTTSSTTGASTATVDGSGSGTTVDVQSGEGKNFKVGSVIKVGSDDNGGAGYEVTGISGDQLTVGTSITSYTDLDAVVPFAPDETVAGQPIAGILGSLTVDGSSFPITSFEVTVTNNMKAIEDEAYQAGTTDYVPGFRDVTGSLSIRCRRDLAIEIGKRPDFTNRNVVVTCGSATGATVTTTLARCQFQVSGVETPQSDEVVIPLEFKALASTAGDNEITIAFT
jgi:hypothetical protein